MPPCGGRLSSGAACPLRRGVASSEVEMSYLLEGGSLPSSEAEMICPLEGGSLPSSEAEVRWPRARRRCRAQSRVPVGSLERCGDRPAGPRGMRMGHMLGFFEFFPFFQFGRRLWAFVGPAALTRVCVLWSGLSTTIRVSLIVVPDNYFSGFFCKIIHQPNALHV